jgi:hypothetical protein
VTVALGGHVQPQEPSLPRWDDFVGQIRVVPVQPQAQRHQDRHAAVYLWTRQAAEDRIPQ